MSTSTSERDRQWVTARRAVVAALHPDRGGDPEAFIAALAALDVGHGLPLPLESSPDVPLIVIVRHPLRRRLIATIRRAVSRIPGTTHHYAYL